MKEKFYSFIKNLQDKITKEFELIDGNEFFAEDVWQRKEGGGGELEFYKMEEYLKRVE